MRNGKETKLPLVTDVRVQTAPPKYIKLIRKLTNIYGNNIN